MINCGVVERPAIVYEVEHMIDTGGGNMIKPNESVSLGSATTQIDSYGFNCFCLH